MRQTSCVLVTLALLQVFVLSAGVAVAQTEAAVTVLRDALAGDVVDREPTPAPAPIPAGVGRICYFTEVSAATPTTIQHVWTWKDQEMATVSLQVSGSRFRTWSCKAIMSEWTGPWKVEARSSDGAVLSSKTFTVGE